MRVLGLDFHRPRAGQGIAALGCVSVLLGSTIPFLVMHEPGMPDRYIAFRDVPLVGVGWAYVMLGVAVISLVAALAGATIVSLCGTAVVLGSLGTTALPIVNLFNGLQAGSTNRGLGFYVMAFGAALAAVGSAIDLRTTASERERIYQPAGL